MTPDVINGLFEFFGSVMLWRNVAALYKDKRIAGVRAGSTAFFMAWGWWNTFYYPHLDQWWSFAGGLSIVIANTVWLVQMLYYGRR